MIRTKNTCPRCSATNSPRFVNHGRETDLVQCKECSLLGSPRTFGEHLIDDTGRITDDLIAEYVRLAKQLETPQESAWKRAQRFVRAINKASATDGHSLELSDVAR